MITDQMVEKAAKRIARTIPLGCGGWNEPHGHDFPLQYSDKEQRLIRDIAKDALTAALGDAGWQDISTAPKDGTTIMLWHESWRCPVSARYVVSNSPCKWIEATLTTQWPEEAFSHWQPLPGPPVTRQDDQAAKDGAA